MLYWTIGLPALSVLFILFFYFLHKIFPSRILRFKIGEQSKSRVTKKEIAGTIISLMIFLLVGALIDWCINKGYIHFYIVPFAGIKLWFWSFLNFLLILFLHDIYFYVTHRFLHLGFIFRRVHSWHHRSITVNPWTAFSFHPFEAIIQIAFIPLIALLIPVSQTVLWVVTAFLLFMTVYGHSGYEFRAKKLKIFNIFNMSIDHTLHHKYTKYHYGLYLNIWDKMFKSISPEKTKTLDQFKQDMHQK